MSTTWSDLTIAQRRLLLRAARAEEGMDRDDAVGMQLDDIPTELHSAVGMCIDYRLVTIDVGWRGSVWVRLTEAGRQVEDGGARE